MIRIFQPLDLRRLEANQFSNVGEFGWAFKDPQAYTFTLEDDDGVVRAIIWCREYFKGCYHAFFLIAEDFRPIHARELKAFIFQAAEDFNIQRLQTESVACAALDAWHRFLGFTLEGTKRKMMYGKDYNMWGWVHGD